MTKFADRLPSFAKLPIENLPAPVWCTVIGIIAIEAVTLWIIVEFLEYFPQIITFTLLFIAFVILFKILFERSSESHQKFVKSAVDLIWNIWSAIGIYIIFSNFLMVEKSDLITTLDKLSNGMLAIVFAGIAGASSARVAISVSEFCVSYRRQRRIEFRQKARIKLTQKKSGGA